jgi:hypothetical protein
MKETVIFLQDLFYANTFERYQLIKFKFKRYRQKYRHIPLAAPKKSFQGMAAHIIMKW